MTDSKLHIAYLTGEYPRVTDTFIQREVAELRSAGAEVETFSVRRPVQSENVGLQQQAERERTYYILPCSARDLIGAHWRLLRGGVGRYFKALGLALRARPPGLKALLYQLFYFAEAGILAEKIHHLGVVHLHNHFANSSCSVAMLAAALGGFTFSFTIHGPAIFFEPMQWRLDEKLKRALFVSCISHFCRSQAMIWAPLDKWDRLHIVHCGVEPDKYVPRTHQGRGRRLMFTGRLAAVKGVPILLQAVAQLCSRHDDLQLTVVGDGPIRADLEAMADRLGIADAVEFVGCQLPQQVSDRLAETDVFVLSSFAEGVPVVLMEAMAAGVPVVTTRIAGVAELVEDGTNGFLAPPGDLATLCERIEQLLDDDDLRSRFGREGQKKVVAQFDIKREAAWLSTIMTAALDGRRSPVRPTSESEAVRPGAEAVNLSRKSV